MTKHERIDLYQDVTNRIVEQLENGVAPWVQPWSSTASGPSLPLNVTTGRRYSGINVLLLWGTVQMCGFTSQRWLTFNQARKVGGSVRKGEKARPFSMLTALCPVARRLKRKRVPFSF